MRKIKIPKISSAVTVLFVLAAGFFFVEKAIIYNLNVKEAEKAEELIAKQNDLDELNMQKNEMFSYEKIVKENPQLDIHENIVKVE